MPLYENVLSKLFHKKSIIYNLHLQTEPFNTRLQTNEFPWQNM